MGVDWTFILCSFPRRKVRDWLLRSQGLNSCRTDMSSDLGIFILKCGYM